MEGFTFGMCFSVDAGRRRLHAGDLRVLHVRLADGAGGWLDPETVKVQFDVINTETDAAKRLRPLTPWGFFKKMRITCGGSLVEDFDYNRTHEMFHMMKPADIRDNDTTEGFEFREGNVIDPNPGNIVGIAGNSRKTVCFTLLSGLLQCQKLLFVFHSTFHKIFKK